MREDGRGRVELRVRAPAKVNLYLEVKGGRPDGYHEISSVMQAVSLFDEMTLALADAGGIALSCSHPALPTDERNLVTRAALLLRRRYGVTQGASISLLKRVPLGGGLGGGSSDAAIALLALSQLWGLNARLRELAELAAELGSDVPYFLWGGTALCEGRGERVSPLPSQPMDYVLVMPPWSVSTPEVYAALPTGLTERAMGSKNVMRALAGGDVDLLGTSLRNDLQESALSLHEGLREVWSVLKESREVCHARGLLLSGSGSSFLVLVRGRREARRAADLLASTLSVSCAAVHSLPAWDGRLLPLTLRR